MAYTNLNINSTKTKSTIEGACNTSGMLKSDGNGNITAAVAGTDYALPGSGGTSDYTDLDNKPQINGVTLSGNKTTADLGINIPTVPTNVSSFTNDAGYLTSESDPTVPSWAKADSKPSYSASEITYGDTSVSEAIANKQDKLTAGSNITITNNVISATGGGSGGSTANDITYDSSATYSDGTVGKSIKTLDDRVTLLEEVTEVTDWASISKIVQEGKAETYFKIGDQFMVPWTDGSTTYQMLFDIVHFGEVELEDGTRTNGMYLESHYLTPYGVQFDANEAFYYCESALAVGTYYITATNGWGSNIVNGESYQFTTTREVPAGGHLVLTQGTADTAFSNWRVYTYANGATTTPIETIPPVKGTSGTKLGDWSSSTKYSTSGMNNMHRSNYGYNRWGQSGIRQWLNSDKAAGQWWIAKNVFDRVPSECATKRGFLAGFGSDFLGAIKPIKTVTALNTVSDTEIGASEITYDKFFLASLEQEYCAPQATGVEGEAWEYWKQTLPQKHNSSVTMPEHIRYGVENHATAQRCRLRSASRGSADGTWYVHSSGALYGNGATSSHRCAPACVIC